MAEQRDEATKHHIAEGMSDPKKSQGTGPSQGGQKGSPPSERITEGMSEAGHDKGPIPKDDELRGGGPGRGAD